ncbi:MAG: hypothetical protein LBV69_09610 [Bacteroidales bacterium]|jgi:hypothetical protein|nr:hypothetical protein [Bacteroidales bacterium]
MKNIQILLLFAFCPMLIYGQISAPVDTYLNEDTILGTYHVYNDDEIVADYSKNINSEVVLVAHFCNIQIKGNCFVQYPGNRFIITDINIT